ncbi:hypothetical protein [Mumia zhuanghuii]|uniref:ABC-2 type transport system permease protein n=1 Tax=Mumia zhuanghuii TaxID=2585211 RepID=A0A5C4MAI8_9ACTN|nr:hypothetical protein [Mumia zhuanghuii]TNC31311.1 hypothetical protein FHE65_32085 [Mumia zhuanghuii]
MTALVPLLVRRYGVWITAWVVTVGVIVVITLPSYGTTYRDAAARRAAVALAQHDAATTLLYGQLPDPGTPGQMFSWEIGTFLTLLVAVMGVLTAVRLTRAAEQDGTLELVRGAGLSRQEPLLAGFVLIGGVALLLSLVCVLGVGLRVGDVAGVDWPGAWTFGFAVGGTFALMALLACVTAQLVPTARAARVAGSLALSICVAARATADTQDIEWLNWFTPLALRATVQPFTADRWAPLVAAGTAGIVVAGTAGVLNARRELGGSLLRAATHHPARLRVRTPVRLAWRLHRSTVLAWTIGTTLGGTLLMAMGSGVIESARRGRVTGGFLKSQLGDGDPVTAYLGSIGAVIAMVVAVFAVLTTLGSVDDERKGPTEYLRATGVSPPAMLVSNTVVALLGSALAIGSTTALTALVFPRVIGGDGVVGKVLAEVGGQWSSMLVLVGPVLLLAGWRPRLAWLGWVPYVGSVALSLVGTLLGVPQWLIALSAFEHPDGIVTPLLRVLFFASAAAIGLLAVQRRDVVVG